MIDHVIECGRVKMMKMEQMLKVETVKFARPRFNPVSPERMKNVRSGLRKPRVLAREQQADTRLDTDAVGVLFTSCEVQGRIT